jgi:hypothetical protein
MARSTAVAFVVLALMTGAEAGTSVGTDTAVWVYGAQRWSPSSAEARMRHLPGAARRLYLSIEDGRRLDIDDPAVAERLAGLLDLATGRLGLAVDAMLLQDPSWGSDPAGASARVARVVAFQRARMRAGRPGFGGLHFDIEPFSTDEWACAGVDERRMITRRLREVFVAVARVVRESGTGLRLSAALPWWLAAPGAERAEAAPRAWLGILDEVVLMVYGEPGGPLIGESAATVLARIGGDEAWAGLPPGRGVRIGLATFEYRDETALAASMRRVKAGLAGRPGFRGLAVFAYGQPFDAPLLTAVEGRVVDGAGRPVAGAVVRGNDRMTRSAPCGLFHLRGLRTGPVEITVEAPGYSPRSVPVAGLVPGRLRQIPPIVLTQHAAAPGPGLP